jgi:spore coat polysaccharide biosynthesis protein SpsF
VRRVLIVQARMTSTRLPGKVLMDLSGRPMLERQIERLRRCRRADDIVVATTANAADDPLVDLARRLGVRWHRGSEADVLARYVGAAHDAAADLVVRLTSDCPLVDPEETDLVIAALEERRDACDYASNIEHRDLPRGLDAEALWRDVLERVGRLATSAAAREHVTWHIRSERPDLYLRHAVRRPYAAGDLRWTVDTPEDLALVRRLYDDLGLAEEPRSCAEILAFVRANPAVAALNAGIEQKRPAG